MASNNSLSDAERAELEQLRAEAKAAEEAKQAQKDREELERLRAQKQAQAQDAARDAQIAAAKAHGAELMEPDDELHMPKGQKIVIALIALFVLAFVVYTFVM